MTSSTLSALFEVLLVNLVLSGDNAVVIGLAARGLSEDSRRRAILLGGLFAVGLRLILTIPAEFLLQVPFLRAGGGILLTWVAYRLLVGNNEESATDEATSISAAIRLIVLADLTMSLDNILAVAAVADKSDHSVFVLTVGLALSIPIVLLGGNLVARLMDRLPILAWIGALILGYTAGQLIVEDKALDDLIDRLPHSGLLFPAILAVGIVGLALFNTRIRRPRGPSPIGAQPGKGGIDEQVNSPVS
jgi:YjbE family integral membrane protein